MDIRRLLAIARKWSLLLIAGVILAAGAAYGFSSLQHKTYEAKTTLIVGQSLTSANPDYAGLLASQQLASTYAAIATTRPQLETVIAQLGLDTSPDQLSRSTASSSTSGSTLLEISAQDSDPGRAAAIANALGTALIAETSSVQGRQKDLQAAIDADLAATQAQITATQDRVTELVAQTTRTPAEETELTTLEARLVSLRSTYATLLGYSSAGAANLLSVVEPAYAPADAIAPKTLLNVLVAAILGLLLAAGIALLAEYRNESVGSASDVERLTGASTLGTIGVVKSVEGRREPPQLTAILYPRSGIAEAYRMLRTNLEFAAVDAGLRTLLVTSARAAEGKSVTAANLAIVYAQAGRKVLLVDGDLRKPSVHLAFETHNDVGLTTALVVGSVGLESIAQITAQPNLSVLPSGPQPPNPAELLSSQRMRALLERALGTYDLVVLDSPPLQAFADAAVLSTLTDGTVLVVDAERSKRRAIQEAREMLSRAGANVLGVVLNRVAGATSMDLADSYGYYVAHANGAAGKAAGTVAVPAAAADASTLGAAAAASAAGADGAPAAAGTASTAGVAAATHGAPAPTAPAAAKTTPAAPIVAAAAPTPPPAAPAAPPPAAPAAHAAGSGSSPTDHMVSPDVAARIRAASLLAASHDAGRQPSGGVAPIPGQAAGQTTAANPNGASPDPGTQPAGRGRRAPREAS